MRVLFAGATQSAAEDYCRVQFEPVDEEETFIETDVPEPVWLAVILMTSFYYENRDIPEMTTYRATRMAFDSLLYPYSIRQREFGRFIHSLEDLPDMVTEFSEELWGSLVDHMTVHSKDSIVFTLTSGMEIKV